MSNQERKERKEQLERHLNGYRIARRQVALLAMRHMTPTNEQLNDVSYHAMGIAEELDRLGMESLR